jgi:hypothetical protein
MCVLALETDLTFTARVRQYNVLRKISYRRDGVKNKKYTCKMYYQEMSNEYARASI